MIIKKYIRFSNEGKFVYILFKRIKTLFVWIQKKTFHLMHLSSLWRSIQIFSNDILSNNSQSFERIRSNIHRIVAIVRSIDLLKFIICSDENIFVKNKTIDIIIIDLDAFILTKSFICDDTFVLHQTMRHFSSTKRLTYRRNLFKDTPI